jgi:hypothetical protein
VNCYRCGYTTDNPPASFACPACGGILAAPAAQDSCNPRFLFWESPSAAGNPLKALVDTLQEVLFRPSKFFKTVKNSTSPVFPSLLFGLVTGSFGITISFLWSLIIPEAASEFQYSSSELSSSTLISAPLYILLQIILPAVYAQVMMRIFRSADAPFYLTLKAACYSESAVILNAVPAVGSILSPVVWLYLFVTGVSTIHSKSWTKTFLIMSIPLILLFLFVFLVLIAVLAGRLAATGIGDFLPVFQ